MSETKTFDATIIRAGTYTVLKQPIVYRAGVAVEYRCLDCGATHPLNPRDWDEARGLYAGRDCGAGPPRIVAVRANNAAYNRAYYATHPEIRDRKNRRARERHRERRRAASAGAGR